MGIEIIGNTHDNPELLRKYPSGNPSNEWRPEEMKC
jgi:hypothetical protein